MSQKTFDKIQIITVIISSLIVLALAIRASTGIGSLVLLTFLVVFCKAIYDLVSSYKSNYSMQNQ